MEQEWKQKGENDESCCILSDSNLQTDTAMLRISYSDFTGEQRETHYGHFMISEMGSWQVLLFLFNQEVLHRSRAPGYDAWF